MNKKESGEFGAMKQSIEDIKTAVTKMDSKLDEVIKNKLDKSVFDEYCLKNRSWIQWLPSVICAIIALLVFVGI